jgi:hypothetical protein
VSDESWADVARASRTALDHLGYGIEPKCLPDEPGACGGSFAEHTAAHLAAIKAVCDHQLAHLGAPAEMIDDVYQHTLAELDHRDQADIGG